MARKVFRRGRDGSSPISEQNSSSTLLTAGERFSGASDDINDYASVAVSVYTSTASVTDGLVLECSIDGETWLPQAKFTVPRGEIFTREVNLNVRYFRVSFRTSGDQTAFNLQTIYHERSATPLGTQLAEQIANAIDTEVQTDKLQALHEVVMLLRLNNVYLSMLVGERLSPEDLPNDNHEN